MTTPPPEKKTGITRPRPDSGVIICCAFVCNYSISGFECVIFLYPAIFELADASEKGIFPDIVVELSTFLWLLS